MTASFHIHWFWFAMRLAWKYKSWRIHQGEFRGHLSDVTDERKAHRIFFEFGPLQFQTIFFQL